jgi:hypothetical protein
MSSPIIWHYPEVRITLSSLWPWFFWGFLLLLLANAALAGTNLIRPQWTRSRATWRLLADSAGAVLLCWMLKANVVAGFFVVERGIDIANTVNWWLAQMFPWAVVMCLAIVAGGVYRIVRRARTRA